MRFIENERYSRTTLVATRVPEGYALYERAGVGENDAVLLARASSLEKRNDLIVRRGETVGLAYRVEGKPDLQPAPSCYFCVLVPVSLPKFKPEPTAASGLSDAVDLLYQTAWDDQSKLNDHIRLILSLSPKDSELQRMIGFTQGVNLIRGWDTCLALTSDIISFQQQQRRGSR